MEVWFDMDGTIADFYGVDGWLNYLKKEDTKPYKEAKTLGNANQIARYMNKLTRAGHSINIISWCSKSGTEEFNARVTKVKLNWLEKHFKSVKFGKILIVPYGTNKKECAGNGILFDDEERNRTNWGIGAFNPSDIIPVMRHILKDDF